MLIRGTRDLTSFVTSAFIVKVDSQRQPDQGAAAPYEWALISLDLRHSIAWPPPSLGLHPRTPFPSRGLSLSQSSDI